MADLKSHWTLDPDIVFLNHGSFGACPRVVLEYQAQLRRQIEREPVRFFIREFQPLFDAARESLADFVGADPDGVAFVDNATTGINTFLNGCGLVPGDEVVVTTQEYGACRNALDVVASRTGARVVEVEIPFPIDGEHEVLERISAALTDATRVVLIDHVVSPTGLVMPVGKLVQLLNARGIDSMIDGAHAPGMLDLDLEALGVTYYAGNCHKWLCAPKGAAFIYVREDRRSQIRPLVISHGATSHEGRFRAEFDWMGTRDPTAMLSVPYAIKTMAGFVDGGWPEIRRRNHNLALEARRILCAALEVLPPCPDTMVGSMVTIPLPDGAESPTSHIDPLQDVLFYQHEIEVPIVVFPHPPNRWMRLSAQIYNDPIDYHLLSSVLLDALETA